MTLHTRSRGAEVLNVNFAERIITVIAVPYGERATVPINGQAWDEIIEPGAFAGAEADPQRIRVNRQHNDSDVVGKRNSRPTPTTLAA